MEKLVGRKKLYGIDHFYENRDHWGSFENIEVVRINLDGVVYEISEDPDDGYRSGHSGPDIVDVAVKNSWNDGIDVICEHVKETQFYNSINDANILRITNAATGAVILEVGTDDISDYYPSYICNFNASAIGERGEYRC